MTDRPALMLLDTASLYFRAYFGVPDSVRAPDGSPVNAVRGLLDFIARLVGDHSPGSVVACWDDDWRPAWRVRLLPSYKAHRVAEEVAADPDEEVVPDPLSVQVPLIAETLGLLGVPVLGVAEHEADDVIGSVATQADRPVDVVTGDRDLIQLVDDERPIRVLYTARGVGRLEILDAAEVRARHGVEPAQYVDYAVLRGDPSDGLPGVAGIGAKTAAALLAAHGSLAGILRAAAAGHPPAAKQGPRLAAAGDYLAVAPQVVTVVRDLDLGGAELTLGGWDEAAEQAWAAHRERWGLGGSADRAAAALAPLRAG